MKGASEDELIAHARDGRATKSRWSASICSRRSAASCCRCRSGGGSRRSTTSSPSRSRRSTATARSTSCAASSRPAPPSASRSIPATTTTSCSTSSRRSPWSATAGATRCASGAGCSGIGACGCKTAVELLERIHAAIAAGSVPADLLALDSQVTDCNAAIFDVANDFHGVIAGCHEILRRQGLLEGIWCLDPNETLGPGQKRGDRPRLRRLSASQRRRFRARRIWSDGCHESSAGATRVN